MAVQGAFGQRPIYDPNNPPPDWVRRMDENRQVLNRINGKDANGMIADRPLWGGSSPRLKLDGKPYTKEELKKIKVLTDPRPEDLTAYKEFLREPHTGIFRIFPDLGCGSQYMVQVSGDCEKIYFGGTSHSFREYSFSKDDLRFFPQELISDGFFSQGILVRLGDVDPATVGLTADGMKFINDLTAPAAMAEARSQYLKFTEGIEAGGYQYKTSVRPESNMTYGFRLIAYRIGNDVTLRIQEDFRHGRKSDDKFRFAQLQEDDRKDLTMVFRIIRIEDDGSLTILWKELRHQAAPKLAFKRREIYRDLKEVD
jgi:hypothetical protein